MSELIVSTVNATSVDTTDVTATGDVSVGDDVLLADGAVVGITGNEVITFLAAGSINFTGATVDVDGAFTASSVASDGAVSGTTGTFTGELTGMLDINIDANGETLDATLARGTLFVNTTQANTYNLPTAAVGYNVCFYSSSAHVITVHPYSGDKIWYGATDLTADNTIDSPGAVGDYACFVAINADEWLTLGQSGTWVDGGE